MRPLLRFRMWTHSLPNVLGRCTGVSRAQRLCWCNVHAHHEMKGTLFSSALLCSVCRVGTLPCTGLLKPPCSLFMWQCDIVGPAPCIRG